MLRDRRAAIPTRASECAVRPAPGGAPITMYADDTIAAVATPPGPGGVGIVRVSGPLAPRIASTVFARSHPAARWRSHQLYHGHVIDETGAPLDEALATLMRQPRSYTGEHVLELHCHGSPLLLRRVLARLLACGARLAAPGEFTKRAFLNGRLDLTQAEAVMDVVRARTAAAATVATRQLGGQLSLRLEDLRSDILQLKALLEAQIDFSEEELALSPETLLAAMDRCKVTIKVLLDTGAHGVLLRDGLRVAIVGKPNVGKSSLLNALLGEERAIVTATPGTTRDSIDETADFEGITVTLSDTAGLRPLECADAVERLGMQRTTAKIAAAQLLLVVVDGALPLDAEDQTVLQSAAGLPQVVVVNKADLAQQVVSADLRAVANGYPLVAVSATQGTGLAALRRAVVDLAVDQPAGVDDGPTLTNLRHVDALRKAADSLGLARQSMLAAQPAEMIAVDVQDAIDHIAAITGAITSEDVLDRIFSEFCIGK